MSESNNDLNALVIPEAELKRLIITLNELQAANGALELLKVETERMEQARTQLYSKYDAVRTCIQRKYSWDAIIISLSRYISADVINC